MRAAGSAVVRSKVRCFMRLYFRLEVFLEKFRRKKGGYQGIRRAKTLLAKGYLTALTIASNAFGSFIARSAITLRLRTIPLALSLPINWWAGHSWARTAALIRVIHSERNVRFLKAGVRRHSTNPSRPYFSRLVKRFMNKSYLCKDFKTFLFDVRVTRQRLLNVAYCKDFGGLPAIRFSRILWGWFVPINKMLRVNYLTSRFLILASSAAETVPE